MPGRPAIGSPNPYKARCPACDAVLVLKRFAARGESRYVCPTAVMEYRSNSALHNKVQEWREWELEQL